MKKYLLALDAGTTSARDEIPENEIAARFLPQFDAAEREKRMSGWKRAIAATRI